MFDFDASKLIMFGVVALIVVGPKELPAALRTVGRVLAKLRRLRADVESAANTLMAGSSLEPELKGPRETMRSPFAFDPATAMRGHLPASKPPPSTQGEALEFASPEMQAYLAPPVDARELAEAEPFANRA